MGKSSLYKIRITIDPERRFKELGVDNSTVLISCYYYQNTREIEKTAHKRYAEYRLPQTEYFKSTSRNLNIMQPAKTPDELAEMYPDLKPWQRDELEVWHRGWITKMMTGDATSEEYNAAIPPHPDPHHPEEDE